MDPVIEKHYKELLGEWKKDDESTKYKLDKIEGMLEASQFTTKATQPRPRSSRLTVPYNL